jgi:hypothetical protein
MRDSEIILDTWKPIYKEDEKYPDYVPDNKLHILGTPKDCPMYVVRLKLKDIDGNFLSPEITVDVKELVHTCIGMYGQYALI